MKFILVCSSKCLSCSATPDNCDLCRDPRKVAPACEDDNSRPNPCSSDPSRDDATCACLPGYYESGKECLSKNKFYQMK